MTNLSASRAIIELAARHGVRDWCVCAGSRNSPLLVTLGSAMGVRLWSFVDERSAAFFALGRARQEGRPVAVVTTSGTAVAELLPATIEAWYSGVPLLLVTADRPARFRGSGAPQAIEQAGIFGQYVEASIDVEACNVALDDLRWTRGASIHINIAFDEPLIEHEPDTFQVDVTSSPIAAMRHESTNDVPELLSSLARPLVLLAGLSNDERGLARDFALRLNAPVYAEPLSGLREDPALGPPLLRAGERILSKGDFDGIIRIGDVPTVRFWRDLEDRLAQLPVLTFSSSRFSGLSRASSLCSIEKLADCRPQRLVRRGELHATDESYASRLDSLFESEPASEPAMFRALSRALPSNSSIFLGNSLPIREWDLAATREPREFRFQANRGANGIDGEVSTFLGGLHTSRPNVAILGDLTTLYDLNAPWIVPQLDEDARFLIVVINNGGGRIFSRVPSLAKTPIAMREKIVENVHGLRFESWAAMFGLDYQAATTVAASIEVSTRGVLELFPDEEATKRFWAAYDALWSTP